MARRAALARAMAMDPQLLLYDEPFAGLDPISLAITARLIRELNAALRATSVIVTHDVAQSFGHCALYLSYVARRDCCRRHTGANARFCRPVCAAVCGYCPRRWTFAFSSTGAAACQIAWLMKSPNPPPPQKQNRRQKSTAASIRRLGWQCCGRYLSSQR